MTIAAGFRFNGGIILCADSEESTGDSVKVSVPKIEVYDKKFSKLILTGAGDADLLNRAFEEIDAAIGPRYTHDAIRGAVEGVVSGIYDRYIYPTPGDKPNIELLVAYQTAKGSDIVKITRRATVRPRGYEVIGLGLLHAAHLMNRWYYAGMTETQAVLLAVYMLQQTKRYVPYCGGPSRICILRPDGAIDWVSSIRVSSYEHFIDRFDEAIGAPFLACLDPAVDDAEFSQSIRGLAAHLSVYRGGVKKYPAAAHIRQAEASAVSPRPSKRAGIVKRKVAADAYRG